MEIILIQTAAVLLIVVLLFLYRKRLSLLITKWMYGKYSNQYIKRFKSLTRTNPYPYCLRADLYQHICLFGKRKSNSKSFKVDSGIIFDKTEFGATLENILKREGEPSCFNIDNINGHQVKIAGFPRQIAGHNLIARYYFVDNHLFKGDYFAKDIQTINKEELSKTVRAWYGLNSDPDITEFYIEGSDNSIYFGDDGFSLLIKFIESGNPFVKELLLKSLS
ncbi:MAG: hypothetical protein K8R53_10840 [Bacteroidales bacterium]|nr:hypothetical protein [Bacteroidales bacterium]